MSKNQKTKKNIQRKYIVFIKKIDENGIVDEKLCGWLGRDLNITKNTKEAIQFTEMENGKGSYSDWISIIGDDHPDWEFSPEPVYVDSVKSLNS